MAFISKLFKYIFRKLHLLALTIVFTVITTYINVYIPQLGGQVIRNILHIGDFNALVWLVIQIVSFTGILGILSFASRYVNGYFSQKIVYEIRNDAFKSIQRQSLAFFDKINTGQLMSRVTTDTERIGRFLGFQFRMLVETVLLLIGVVASMIMIDWELTIVSFLIVLLIPVSYTHLTLPTN